MALSFLKKLATTVPAGSMIYQLHNHLTGKQPARSLDKVHASALTKAEGLCPRYYALHDVEGTKPQDEWLTTSEVVTYDIGHKMQDQIIEWFAEMGKVIGDWQCLGCGTMHLLMKKPDLCHECHCPSFKNHEVRFKSLVNSSDCGIDMLRIVGEKKLRCTEIKTMDKDEFKGLVAPLAEHRIRTNLYLRIIEESGQSKDLNGWEIDTEQADVLYTTKGGFGVSDPNLKQWNLSDKFSPFKEYAIKRDDTKTEHLAERAQVVHDFRAGAIPMPCGICSSAKVKRAEYCDRKTLCFSGKHPPLYDWSDK